MGKLKPETVVGPRTGEILPGRGSETGQTCQTQPNLHKSLSINISWGE